MTTEAFTTWLQGYFELSDAKTLDERQVTIIKDHLALVFDKVTPDRNKKEETSPSQEITSFKKKRLGGYHPGSSGSGVLLC